MSEYRDYKYHKPEATHAHLYAYDKLVKMLDRSRKLPIFDLRRVYGSVANTFLQQSFNIYSTDASEKRTNINNSVSLGKLVIQYLSSDNRPELRKEREFYTKISTEVIGLLNAPLYSVSFPKMTLLGNGGYKLYLDSVLWLFKKCSFVVCGQAGATREPASE